MGYMRLYGIHLILDTSRDGQRSVRLNPLMLEPVLLGTTLQVEPSRQSGRNFVSNPFWDFVLDLRQA